MSFHSIKENRAASDTSTRRNAKDGRKYEVYGSREVSFDDDFEIGKSKSRKSTVTPVSNAGVADDGYYSVIKQKPTMTFSRKSSRDDELSSQQAVEFLIKERQAMDAVYAALREENEELRSQINTRDNKPSPDKSMCEESSSPTKQHTRAVSNQQKSSPRSRTLIESERMECWEDKDEGGSISGISCESATMASVGARSTASMQHRKAAAEKKGVPPLAMKDSSPTTSPSLPLEVESVVKSKASARSNASRSTQSTHPAGRQSRKPRQYSGLPQQCWRGMRLWKIPYSGTGLAEERNVRIKHAPAAPGLNVRVIEVIQGQNKESKKGYIAFPPTLQWSDPGKADDKSNSRQLVLSKDDHVTEGYSSVAYLKGKRRGNPLPPEPLCFSIVTSTRSLDLAAETLEDAIMWKGAIRELIAMLGSGNPDWTITPTKTSTRKPAWKEYLRISGADERRESDHSADESEVEEEEEEEEEEDDEGEEEDSGWDDKDVYEPSQGTLDVEDDPDSNASYHTATIAARKSSLRDKLFAAIEGADYATVERILFTGIVDASIYDTHRQCTPLMAACKNGLADIAKLCVQFGSKVDMKSDKGHTALHYAAECGSAECAQVVLKAAKKQGVSAVLANIKNHEGKTPFLICSEYGEMPLVKMLLANGASIAAIDKKSKNCLHLCASYGHEACLALLLDSGGDGLLESRDILGNTALHYAAKYGHLESARLLLETAANALARNEDGHTPYDLAGEQGYEEVCTLLYEYMNTSPLKSPHKRQISPVKKNKAAINSPIDTSTPRVHSQSTGSFSSMFEGLVVNSKGNASSRTSKEADYSSNYQHATNQDESSQYDHQGSEWDGYFQGGEWDAVTADYSRGGSGEVAVDYGQDPYYDYGEGEYAAAADWREAVGEASGQTREAGYGMPLEEFELNYSKWSVYESEEGYPYYLEASTQHSQWEDPRLYGVVLLTNDDGMREENELVDGQDDEGEVFTRPRKITPKKLTPKKLTPKKSTPVKHAEARAKRTKPQRVVVEMTPPRYGPGDLFSSSDEEDIRTHMANREERRLPYSREQDSKNFSARNRSPEARSPLSAKKTGPAIDLLRVQGPPVSALSPDLSASAAKRKTKKKLVILNVEASLSPRPVSEKNTYDMFPEQAAQEYQAKSAVHLASTLRRSLVDSIQNSPKRSGTAFFDNGKQQTIASSDSVRTPQGKRFYGQSEGRGERVAVYDSGDDWDAEEESVGVEGGVKVSPKRDRWDFSAEKRRERKTGPRTDSNRSDERTARPASMEKSKIFSTEDGTYGSGGNIYRL